MKVSELFEWIKVRLVGFYTGFKGNATELVEWEAKELENIFSVLVLGCFVGVPSPPLHITTELMPYMEKNLVIMLDKVSTSHDALGELFGLLGID